MIKVEAIQQFTLGKFSEIKNLKRKGADVLGTIFVGDTFECTQDMAEYLTGKNAKGAVVVKVIEVIPEPKKGAVNEVKPEVLKEALKKVAKPVKKKASKK